MSGKHKQQLRVLRVPRVDGAHDFSLLGVTRLSPPSKPLHLKIEGTDGENVYVATVKHGTVSALRLSSNHDSPAVWEAIVRTTLLGPDGSESEHVSFESIELVTSLKDSVSLTLVWRRKDAAGSTVDLGQVDLGYTEDVEIPIFDWASSAAATSSDSLARIAALEADLAERDATISTLQDRLQGVVQAKLEHETSLVHKFGELLNSKKLRIRELERVLASADHGGPQSMTVRAREPPSSPSRSPRAPTAGRKRKAGPPHSNEDEHEDASQASDSSDAFEKVLSRARTPQRTPSNADTDDIPTPPPQPRPAVRKAIGGKAKAKAAAAIGSAGPGKGSGPGVSESSGQASKDKANVQEGEETPPPPVRDLPFTRSKQRPPVESAEATVTTETATTDTVMGDVDDGEDDADETDVETDDEL